MHGPHAILRHGERRVTLRPGSLIGRMSTCALRIQDVHISEAHALLTLRGRELTLLALRGHLRVDGVIEDAVALSADLTLELAPGVWVTAEQVVVPARVLVLDVEGGETLEPCAAMHALLPDLRWSPAWRSDAVAHVWSTDADWVLQRGHEVDRIVAGGTWQVGTARLRARLVDVEMLASPRTRRDDEVEPFEVVGRTETAIIRRVKHDPIHVGGLPARLVTELGLFGQPTAWELVAGELWPETVENRPRSDSGAPTPKPGVHGAAPPQLRSRFDRVLQRLRLILREHGARDDLVRSFARGSVELHLGPGGRFIDEA